MFSYLKAGILAWCYGSTNLEKQWVSFQPRHRLEMKQVFETYNVSSRREILNLEPSIDHTKYYGTKISDYFSSNDAMDWLLQYYPFLPDELQYQTRDFTKDIVTVFAADAMCHPRNRVGKFDWSDVLTLTRNLPGQKPSALLRTIKSVHSEDYVDKLGYML